MTLLVNYSVYRKLFQKDEDSKLYAAIWALQKDAPILVLYNNLKLNPGNFLSTVCPLKKKTKVEPIDINIFLQQKCSDNEKVFTDKIQIFYMRLLQWITMMNSDHLKEKDGDHMLTNTSFMTERANLVIKGVKLATEIKRTLKQYLLLYEVNKFTVSQKQFTHIIHAIEMLKAIEIEFKTKKFLMNKWVVLINRHSCEIITRILEKGLQKIYAMKKGSNQTNMLELTMKTIECYRGGYNAIRKTIARHCINLVIDQGIVSTKEEIKELFV